MIDIKLAARGKVAGMGENILCGVKFRVWEKIKICRFIWINA
jgi:hypothetical protein